MTKSFRLTIASLAAAGIASSLLAMGHADAINARQEHMKGYGAALGVLGKMAQGEVAYDAAAASEAASKLADLAAADQSGFWVEGSDINSGIENRALPAIWDNLADFDAKGQDLATAAAAMAAVAGDGLEAVQGQMRGVGGACAGCHRPYRQPQ